MGGRRFIDMCVEGSKLSKHDRFLLCSNFFSTFPITFITILPIDLSDHSPIILKTSALYFGPGPFRCF